MSDCGRRLLVDEQYIWRILAVIKAYYDECESNCYCPICKCHEHAKDCEAVTILGLNDEAKP